MYAFAYGRGAARAKVEASRAEMLRKVEASRAEVLHE